MWWLFFTTSCWTDQSSPVHPSIYPTIHPPIDPHTLYSTIHSVGCCGLVECTAAALVWSVPIVRRTKNNNNENVQVSLLKWFDHFDFIWSPIEATRSVCLTTTTPCTDGVFLHIQYHHHHRRRHPSLPSNALLVHSQPARTGREIFQSHSYISSSSNHNNAPHVTTIWPPRNSTQLDSTRLSVRPACMLNLTTCDWTESLFSNRK